MNSWTGKKRFARCKEEGKCELDNDSKRRGPGTKMKARCSISQHPLQLKVITLIRCKGKSAWGSWKRLCFPNRRYRQERRTYLSPPSLLELVHDASGVAVVLWLWEQEARRRKANMLSWEEQKQKQSRSSTTLLSCWNTTNSLCLTLTFLSDEKNRTLIVYRKVPSKSLEISKNYFSVIGS